MTVLEAEEEVDERSAPPRKKFRLSSIQRRQHHNIARNNLQQPPHSSIRGGFYEGLNTINYNDNNNKMLNGHRNQHHHHHLHHHHHYHHNHDNNPYDTVGTCSDNLKIATLCNLGNTCFLNSVIYTLRFAPSFLHNLHHLAVDLSNLNEKQQHQQQFKSKSSSLGRTNVSLTSSGNRSWSNKDLSGIVDINKPRIQVATEKLHDLFRALRESESSDHNEPYQPDAFLQALRDVNPIFEGNQQQDAHELLVCLLDNIRETFQLLVRYRESEFGQSNSNANGGGGGGGGGGVNMERLLDMQYDNANNATSSKSNIRKKKLKKYAIVRGNSTTSITQTNYNNKPFENGHSDFMTSNNNNNNNTGILFHRPESKKCFISEDFEGVSLLRTTCLECEHVTERKETFCDICVPIETGKSNEKDENGKLIDSSEVYRNSVVTSELLCGRDKYWCASCLRYNEARRAVTFPSLPRLLVLQLKRFSTAAGSMEKINHYMPTPLTLDCFCEDCSKNDDDDNDDYTGGVTTTTTTTTTTSSSSSSSTSSTSSSTSSSNNNNSNNNCTPSTSTGNRRKNCRHVYKLYSIIMHQGATMTAGHYIAYTKVPDDSMYNEYAICDRDCHGKQNLSQNSNNNNSSSSSTTSSNNNSTSSSMSILKYFKSKSNINENKEHLIKMACRSLECCSIRRGKNLSTWLECDDEAVKAIQEHELLDKLSPNSRNSATPYLLFYVRSSSSSSTTT